MVIPFVVPEILGGGTTPPPDVIKLSEKADAINRYAPCTNKETERIIMNFLDFLIF